MPSTAGRCFTWSRISRIVRVGCAMCMCAGGLRRFRTRGWSRRGRAAAEGNGAETIEGSDREEFHQAVEFLFRVRCFLHYRHERDDNTLDWQAQDAAAAAAVGLPGKEGRADAAYWMRLYFRHARSIERQVNQKLEEVSDGRARMLAVRARRGVSG